MREPVRLGELKVDLPEGVPRVGLLVKDGLDHIHLSALDQNGHEGLRPDGRQDELLEGSHESPELLSAVEVATEHQEVKDVIVQLADVVRVVIEDVTKWVAGLDGLSKSDSDDA